MTLRKNAARPTQRWALLAVAVGLLILALGATALAVHDATNIQLDGNAVTDAAPAVGNGDEDWDLICKAHQVPTGECDPSGTLPAGSTTATGSQFLLDAYAAASDDVYTTGGSKDDLDISSWKFKNAAPSPDKADLEHAMAALYSNGDRYVYFAADRYTNEGDVNIAFWFLQDEVAENGDGGATPSDPPDTTLCSLGSGCNFSGTHVAHGPGPDGYICYAGQGGYRSITASTGLQDGPVCGGSPDPGADDTRGDVLVVSAFTGGGTQPNIQIYEWVGLNNAPLLPAQSGLPKKDLKVTSNRSVVAIPTGATLSAGCATGGLSNDPACAIVNTGALTTHPWEFAEKGGGTVPQQGEFFEGGLNLTDLGFGDTCFSTFVVNTRSSQSVDSVLHDFALGQLGSCDTTLTTSAGSAAGLSIDDGSISSGVDNATLTVSGVATWGGELKFYICGPLAAGAVCNANGVLVSTVTVSQASAQPIPSGNGTTTGFATLTSAGRYCWFASFTPDAATLAKGVSGDSDDGSGATPNPECFTVSPVTPTLDTQAMIPNPGTPPPAYVAVPAGYKTPFGQAVYDQATLSGAATEPGSGGANTTYPTINPTTAGTFAGTIGFTLKGPDGGTPTCSTTNAVAYTGETQTFPINVNVTGNTTHGPVSFVPNSPGTYHWVAVYTNAGSVNNASPVTHNSGCTDSDENVTVEQIPTDLDTRQFVFPQDKVEINTTPTGQTLDGTIKFRLYGPTAGADPKTALQNCQADTSNAAGAQGLVYTEGYTTAIDVDGASPRYVTTNNTSFRITASPVTYVWKVIYTSNLASQTSSASNCEETTTVTYSGNDDTITIP